MWTSEKRYWKTFSSFIESTNKRDCKGKLSSHKYVNICDGKRRAVNRHCNWSLMENYYQGNEWGSGKRGKKRNENRERKANDRKSVCTIGLNEENKTILDAFSIGIENLNSWIAAAHRMQNTKIKWMWSDVLLLYCIRQNGKYGIQTFDKFTSRRTWHLLLLPSSARSLARSLSQNCLNLHRHLIPSASHISLNLSNWVILI